MWRDWEETNLAAIGEYINGYAFKPSDWGTRGLPIIRIAQITGTSDFDNFYNSPLPHKYKISANDIIFSWSGTLAVVEWNKRDGWLNQHLFKVVPSNKLNRRFFFHILQNSVEEMTKKAHGSTMHHIKRGELVDFTLNIPKDPEEQKAIAEVLDTVDEAIAATQAMLEKQDKIKDGLLQDLLTRGVDASGTLRPCAADAPNLYKPSPLGLIPKGWDVKSLEKITSIIIDGTHHTPNYTDSGVPFLRVTDIHENVLNPDKFKYVSLSEHEQLKKRVFPQRNDILYSKNGTIGIAKVVDWDWEFSIFVSLCLMRVNEKHISTRFLENFLNSRMVKKQIEIRSKQGTIINLHLEEIREFDIIIPSFEEQAEICRIITAQKTEEISLQDELTKLKKLKAGLMQDLLTGKKRVPSALKEAA